MSGSSLHRQRQRTIHDRIISGAVYPPTTEPKHYRNVYIHWHRPPLVRTRLGWEYQQSRRVAVIVRTMDAADPPRVRLVLCLLMVMFPEINNIQFNPF